MANSRVSDLGVAGALAGTDLFYVVQTAGVGGVKATGAQVAEFIRDTVAGFAVGGSNISIVHNDAGDTLTFSFTGSLTGDTITIDNSGFVVLTATDDQALWDEADALFDDTLRASNNLSDLADPATARANLGIRDVLTANRTYYVNASTGSDSNDGLSSGTPFLTLQKAFDTIGVLVSGIYDITISVAAGTYTNALGHKYKPPAGTGSVTLQGAGATTVITATGSLSGYDGLIAVDNVNKPALTVRDVQLDNSGGATGTVTGLTVSRGGSAVMAGTVYFGDFGSTSFSLRGVAAFDRGLLTVSGAIQVNNSASIGNMFVCADATIRHQSQSVTFGTSVTLNRYVEVTGGYMFLTGITWTGSFTGVRYDVKNLGFLQVNGAGATYIPGSTAGSTSNGGLYV